MYAEPSPGLVRLLSPRAEEFRPGPPAAARKEAEQGIVVGVLNNRWASMAEVAAILEEESRQQPGVRDVLHWRIAHSKPTPPDVMAEVAAKCHLVIVGLGN